jgi:hypothetical protein
MRRRPKLTEYQFDKFAEELRSWIQANVSPFDDLRPEAREERKARARWDKEYFCQTYFPHYFYNDFADFHEEWFELAEIEDELVPVAAPREHAKSTVFTFGNILHSICYELRHFWLIISDTADQATGFSLPIRLELEENPRIRHDFGDLRGRRWRDSDFVTSTDVRVLARGRGDKVRGLKWKQWRPDGAVIDDFENDKNVKNPRLVEEGMDWLLTAVYASLKEPFSMLMVGNIFAPKSILAQLIDEKITDEDTGEKRPRYPGRIYRAEDEDGNPLWPEQWSKERLAKKRRGMGTVRYNREYLNLCLDERNPIQPHWFLYYVRSEIVGRELMVASFLDPSAKSGMANDFKAIVTVGLYRLEMLFHTLHAWIRHATINEMWEALWRIHAEYGGSVGVEENMFGEFLTESYKTFATQKKKFLPLALVHHVTDKEGRMLGTLAPLLEFGRVKFERGHSDQDLLVEQTLYIVNSTVNDDGPDALEGAVSMLQGTGEIEFQATGMGRDFRRADRYISA